MMRRSDVLILLAALGGAVSCEGGSIHFYTCEDPCKTCSDPCSDCPGGECVPLPAFGWEGPGLLWMGNELEAPRCPDHAPQLAYEGHAGLDASVQCAACACGEPACALPTGITASTLPVCPNDGPGAVLTPLDAPPGWDGSCVALPPVQASPLASVSTAPLEVTPCAPIEVPVPQIALHSDWSTFARACRGNPPAMCRDRNKYCAPTSEPPPSGFQQCLFKDGDQPMCPPDYPERHVLYQGFSDTRACTPCACAPPSVSQCVALVQYYEDTACIMELGLAHPTNDAAACSTIPGAAMLGSMDAALVTDHPGACAPLGGEPVGEATPIGPSTFCCLPPRSP